MICFDYKEKYQSKLQMRSCKVIYIRKTIEIWRFLIFSVSRQPFYLCLFIYSMYIDMALLLFIFIVILVVIKANISLIYLLNNWKKFQLYAYIRTCLYLFLLSNLLYFTTYSFCQFCNINCVILLLGAIIIAKLNTCLFKTYKVKNRLDWNKIVVPIFIMVSYFIQ